MFLFFSCFQRKPLLQLKEEVGTTLNLNDLTIRFVLGVLKTETTQAKHKFIILLKVLPFVWTKRNEPRFKFGCLSLRYWPKGVTSQRKMPAWQALKRGKDNWGVLRSTRRESPPSSRAFLTRFPDSLPIWRLPRDSCFALASPSYTMPKTGILFLFSLSTP